MRRLLAVSLWLIATAGVTYVASAAVTLVDLQVFPQGQRVEVLARPARAPTTTILPTSTTAGGSTGTTVALEMTVPTTTVEASSTTSAVSTTTAGPPTATVVSTTTAGPPTATVVSTTTAGPPTTTVVSTTTTGPPTTTVVSTTTTSSGGSGVQATTTTRPPATTTTRPPATTTTRPVPPLTVETSVLSGATVGSGFEAALVATGGQRPHTWQLAGGVLPPGLALSSAGRISGAPQAAGQFTFSVRVSDGSGRSATASYTVTAIEALRVLTSTLPEASAGSAYGATLEATGGRPPYRWEVTEGRLPAGLALSSAGVVSGTPTGGAPATVVVAATDARSSVAHSGELAIEFAADRRTVAARGGTVFVDVLGDSVSLFLASPADGFSVIVVEAGGFRVEVQFVPLQGDATSWVVCEVADAVVCSHG